MLCMLWYVRGLVGVLHALGDITMIIIDRYNIITYGMLWYVRGLVRVLRVLFDTIILLSYERCVMCAASPGSCTCW